VASSREEIDPPRSDWATREVDHLQILAVNRQLSQRRIGDGGVGEHQRLEIRAVFRKGHQSQIPDVFAFVEDNVLEPSATLSQVDEAGIGQSSAENEIELSKVRAACGQMGKSSVGDKVAAAQVDFLQGVAALGEVLNARA